jgi:hypothetical protein
MPFFQIKDKYIFLYFDNYNKLNEIALKDKEPSSRLRSHISGREESKENYGLRYRQKGHISGAWQSGYGFRYRQKT